MPIFPTRNGKPPKIHFPITIKLRKLTFRNVCYLTKLTLQLFNFHSQEKELSQTLKSEKIKTSLKKLCSNYVQNPECYFPNVIHQQYAEQGFISITNNPLSSQIVAFHCSNGLNYILNKRKLKSPTIPSKLHQKLKNY